MATGIKKNTLKQNLSAGQTVVGSFVYVPSSKFTEIVGLCGYDFVVIDMEHGPVDFVVAEEMIRAAEIAGTTPLLRVAHNTPHLVLRALDIGAQGLHIPDVNSVDDARRAVRSSRYGPEGERGLAGVRAANYGLEQPLNEYCREANKQIMVIAHIESLQAVEALDSLLEVDGIDVYYLGPQDLSNSMGIPGQSGDERVRKLVDESIERIVQAGRTAGCIATDADIARRYIDLGARYIASHAVRHMADASRRFIKVVLE